MQNIRPEDSFELFPETPPPLPKDNGSALFDNMNKNQKFKFHGNASEYFGIWIVNILLTIITLGFYAPWAKVRRLRYFYGNTELTHRRFDFTGIPSRILIGRLIAIGIYFAVVITSEYSLTIASLGFIIIYLSIPWLLCATLKFRGRNSKWGNSRFYFSGKNKGAYLEFFKGLFLVIFTLGLAFPVVVWLYKRYFLNHLYIGQLKFKLHADWSTYMGAMYVPILGSIGLFCALAVIFYLFLGEISAIFEATHILGLLTFLYVIALLFIWPWMMARIFITTWNNTTLSESQFKTSSYELAYAWIVVSNWILKILSLGLMTPWAAIRLYKYQVESLSLQLNDDPDTMFNRSQDNPVGVAEEIADIFDFDISL